MQEGTDEKGRRWQQRWGWIGSPQDRRRRYVRQITLSLAGQQEVALITDLLDEQLYPAADLLEVYLRRWGIENMFQQVTEVFALDQLIGSTQAAIFQGAFCLLLYNMVQLIRSYVAQAADRPPASVSAEKLFVDVQYQLISWATAGDAGQTAAALESTMSDSQLQAWLSATLAPVWSDRWIKAKPKKNTPRPTIRVPTGHGGHTSAWKLIQQYTHPRNRHPQNRVRS
jgi:hypothetical protein